MQSFKTFFLCTIVIFVMGCGGGSQSFDPGSNSLGPAGQKTDAATIKRFQDTNPNGPTAVESAIELSKKYAILSDEIAKLKVEKQDLQNEKARLDQQTSVLEQELKQTKKELSEANDLLVEMRIELNNWKSDILGFRDEIRQADKVQLETLLKILRVLGGEVDITASADPQPGEQVQ